MQEVTKKNQIYVYYACETHEDACASPGKPSGRRQVTSVGRHGSTLNTAAAPAAEFIHVCMTKEESLKIRAANQSGYRAE